MKRLVCDSCGASETVDDNDDNECPMCGDRMELLYSTDPNREARVAARDLYALLEMVYGAVAVGGTLTPEQLHECQQALESHSRFASMMEDTDGAEVPGGDAVEFSGAERAAGEGVCDEAGGGDESEADEL
jgi:hypothetical protein